MSPCWFALLVGNEGAEVIDLIKVHPTSVYLFYLFLFLLFAKNRNRGEGKKKEGCMIQEPHGRQSISLLFGRLGLLGHTLSSHTFQRRNSVTKPKGLVGQGPFGRVLVAGHSIQWKTDWREARLKRPFVRVALVDSPKTFLRCPHMVVVDNPIGPLPFSRVLLAQRGHPSKKRRSPSLAVIPRFLLQNLTITFIYGFIPYYLFFGTRSICSPSIYIRVFTAPPILRPLLLSLPSRMPLSLASLVCSSFMR
jgi:hypothetical protein